LEVVPVVETVPLGTSVLPPRPSPVAAAGATKKRRGSVANVKPRKAQRKALEAAPGEEAPAESFSEPAKKSVRKARAARAVQRAAKEKPDFQPEDGPYSYNADPEDHCETDIRAYQHLRPLLLKIEFAIYGRNAGQLKLWDPYFCNGAVVQNLAKLGFPQVHNKNEDFYAVLKSGKLPPHDVLITSPPYSEDHIEKCMRYCASSGKPWCVLLPNWVHKKSYFQELLRETPSLVNAPPNYLGPVGRPYHYWFPSGSNRPNHVGSDGMTTPFHSSWHIHLTGRVGGMRLMRELEAERKSTNEWVMAKTVKGLKWCGRKVQERAVAAKAREAARAATQSAALRGGARATGGKAAATAAAAAAEAAAAELAALPGAKKRRARKGAGRKKNRTRRMLGDFGEDDD